MKPEAFEHSGVLKYSQSGQYRLVAEIDPELTRYYRTLVPKYYNLSQGRYPAHVTIVRTGKDNPKNLTNWNKYEDQRVYFQYETGVKSDNTYFWLRILSKQFEEIRTELGLELIPTGVASYSKPPSPFVKYFHCTIGNKKNLK